MSHSTGTLIPGPTAPSNGPLALTLESAWAPRASWVPCATDATHSRSSTRPPFYSPRSLGRRIETRCSRNKARPLPLPLCRRSTPGCRFETPVGGDEKRQQWQATDLMRNGWGRPALLRDCKDMLPPHVDMTGSSLYEELCTSFTPNSIPRNIVCRTTP